MGFRNATEGVLVGYTGNNVLPARAGEFLRAIYLGNKEAVSRVSVLGTIFIERIFEGLVIVGVLLLCTLLSAPPKGPFRGDLFPHRGGISFRGGDSDDLDGSEEPFLG